MRSVFPDYLSVSYDYDLSKAMLNVVNISTYKKEKNKKEYLAQQLYVTKNSCSKNYRETSLF